MACEGAVPVTPVGAQTSTDIFHVAINTDRKATAGCQSAAFGLAIGESFDVSLLAILGDCNRVWLGLGLGRFRSSACPMILSWETVPDVLS